MDELLTNDATALRMLMTEELFFVREETAIQPPAAASVKSDSKPESPASFSYLGDNNKYFLVLVNDASDEHLNKEHREMLLKILQAKSLELRDVAIFNVSRYPGVSFASIKEFFAPSRVVVFGIDPISLGLPAMTSNEPQVQENVKFLATYNFAELTVDQNKKRILWNAIKSF